MEPRKLDDPHASPSPVPTTFSLRTGREKHRSVATRSASSPSAYSFPAHVAPSRFGASAAFLPRRDMGGADGEISSYATNSAPLSTPLDAMDLLTRPIESLIGG